MAKETVFLVSKIGWEYNDEHYYRPECGGGTPVLAYTTYEKAQAECDRRNAPLKNPYKGYSRLLDEDDILKGIEADKYGLVPITENYEVVPVEMED